MAAVADEDAPTSGAAPARPSAVRGLFKRDMERQEQLLSFAAAGLAVVLGVVGAVSAHPTTKTVGKHTTTTPAASPALIIGLSCGLAVVLWLVARHGSRVATALVSMALFLTAFAGTILGIPYVVLGGWLLIRNSRTMREERMAAQKQGGGSAGAGGSRSGAGSRPAREPRPSRRARREAAEAEARRIEANKRYTPPTPRRRPRG